VAIKRTKGYRELSLVDKMTKHVMYFAYGSNLLAQMIHISHLQDGKKLGNKRQVLKYRKLAKIICIIT